MSPADDHSRWEELAVGHALSALEPDDEEAFAGHLRTCPECTATVAETRDVMASLAEAAEPAEPPASLRASILEGVSPGQQAAPGARRTEDTGSGDAESGAGVDELERRRRSGPTTGRHERRKGMRLPWYAAAAAILVMLVLATGNVVQLVQNDTQQERLAQADRVVGCVESETCKTVPIRAAEGSSVPAMALVQDGHVRLMVDGLDTNNAGNSMYVLWQHGGGQLRALRGFDITESGVAWVDGGRLGASLKSTKFLAVSHEPGNELPGKPTKVVAVGNVSS